MNSMELRTMSGGQEFENEEMENSNMPNSMLDGDYDNNMEGGSRRSRNIRGGQVLMTGIKPRPTGGSIVLPSQTKSVPFMINVAKAPMINVAKAPMINVAKAPMINVAKPSAPVTGIRRAGILIGGKSSTGSKIQVWHGTAKHTSGGLTKKDLMKHKGRIVSRKKHAAGKKAIKNLRKAGYIAKKGTFKLFRKK